MVKIVWTEASINDLKEIFEYISEDEIKFVTSNNHSTFSKKYCPTLIA